MNSKIYKRFCVTRAAIQRIFAEEKGQVLPWAVLLIIMFLGMCALTVDVGHAVLVQHQLQASADAAALAAAESLGTGSPATVGMNYTSKSGSKNEYAGFTSSTPQITTRCSTAIAGPPWNIPCTSTAPNLVTVVESATIPTIFAGILGHRTLTIGATASASKGAKPQPYNVAIVLDTTASMNNSDSNCGKTQLACAEDAIGVILNGLAPTQDNVSLFTFPAMTTDSADNDTNCSGSRATGTPYTFPSTTATSLQTMGYNSGGRSSSTVQTTYQITDFLSDYRGSDTAKSLANGSLLTKAIGSSQGCRGLKPNNTQNTYFAATIYQAQAALVAEQAANPKTKNAMILLSDGNATAVNNSSFSDMATSSQTSDGAGGVKNTSDGKYPNLQGECGQAVDAATLASNAGTTIFTIAYGSPSTSKGGGSAGNAGNCGTDVSTGQHPNITPCQTMQKISTGWNSTPQVTSHFYSDYYAPGGDSGCQASGANNTITSLSNIAASIVGQLSGVRLVPNGLP
jgi:Flp pilus assembly protein TadG